MIRFCRSRKLAVGTVLVATLGLGAGLAGASDHGSATTTGAEPGAPVPAIEASAARALPTASAGRAGPRIGRAGVGRVRIGKRFVRLRRQGLVGKLRRGCELGGPRTRSAALRAPLRGSVDFTQRRPRRVNTITLTGGPATIRGLGIGATIPQIRRAFPRAALDRELEHTFGFALLTVPNRRGKVQFAVDTESSRTELIGIPFVPLCD